MSIIAVLLVVVSALVHAGWNLLGKRDSSNGAYFCIAAATGTLVMLPLVVLWSEAVWQMPPAVWWYLIPTGLFQGLYFTGLAGAYRSGDLSVAYPVARAFPVLLVPIASALLGRGDSATLLALGGMVVVTVGLLVIPQRRLFHLSASPLGGTWMLYAFLAGLGTTGYSVIDDTALSLYRSGLAAEGQSSAGAASGLAALQAPVIYAAFQSLSTAVVLAILSVVKLGPAGFAAEVRKTPLRSAVAAGIAIVAAYGLILIAYGFARDVSYVVAFRQLSLPLGTLLGVVLLGEKVNPARLAGTALIIAGLVLVGLG
ncbi:MAG: drug/metabolite transporter [Spirochaetota bacterium]